MATKSMISAIKLIPQLDDQHRIQLLQTLSSTHALISSEVQESICLEASRLYNILRKVRFILERLASDPSAQADIEYYYGKSVFKCPRLYCKWFYEGFDTAAERDEHVAYHERAYCCIYIGCEYATAGFKTESELDTHYDKFHQDDFRAPLPLSPLSKPRLLPPAPRRTSLSEPPPAIRVSSPNALSQIKIRPATQFHAARMFAGSYQPAISMTARGLDSADPGYHDTPVKRPRQDDTFACDVCSRNFQRASHLRVHRRTHANAKPFICTVCSDCFAHHIELTRHSLLHTGDLRFTCRGSLRLGQSWGCGKKFPRADGLARHFKGAAGTLCLKPMTDEEESLKWQASASIGATSPAPPASLQAPAQANSQNHGHLSTSSTDWNDILLLASTYVPGFPTDALGYDDTYPNVLYEQHPELLGLNWHAVRPE